MSLPPRSNAKPRKVSPIGWQARLTESATPAMVVAVAQDFLAALGAPELEEMPADCRPGPIDNPQHVMVYALRLAHRHDGDAKSAPALHRVATFFTRAALRLYQIAERSQEVAAERRAPRKVAGDR